VAYTPDIGATGGRSVRPLELLGEEPPRCRDDGADLLHGPVEEATDLVGGSGDIVLEAPVEGQDVLDIAR
jgi:hypothetical protein